MSVNMHDWLSRFHDFARGAWRKLPLESLAVVTAAVSAMVLVHRGPPGDAVDAWMMRLLLGSLLVTPLCFACTLLHERGLIRGRVRLGLGALAAAAVLGAMTLALPVPTVVEHAWFTWPYGLSLLAAILVPFVAVAVGAGADRLVRFTVFLRRFFEQTTTWVLLWLGSMTALAVIFGALDELFDLDVDELGADVALGVTGVLVLSYLFRLLPAAADGGRERMPELWRRLATTVGAPFVSVMLVILVIYEAVVLARGELPRNLLSPLIIAAGFVGFLCTLVIVSIQGEAVGSGTLAPADPHRWARRHSVRLARAFPPVLLVLLPMAAWALAVRIDQHGFTPFRVARMMALVCLGGMSLLGTVRWLRGRMALTWEVPLCIVVFALATAFGPVSAMRLSLDSQLGRLEQTLAAAELPRREVAAEITPATHLIDNELHWELYDGIRTVAELGGEPALRRVFTGAVGHCAERWQADDCLQRLGVAARPRAEAQTYQTAVLQEPVTSPGGELVFVDVGTHDAHATGLHLRLAQTSVKLHDGDRELAAASMEDVLAAWRASGVLPPHLLALAAPDGAVLGHVVAQRLELYQPTDDEWHVTRLTGAWLRPQPPPPPAP